MRGVLSQSRGLFSMKGAPRNIQRKHGVNVTHVASRPPSVPATIGDIEPGSRKAAKTSAWRDRAQKSNSSLRYSGASARSRQALEQVSNELVDKNLSLIRLLDPPFDKSSLNPGYLKGYLPGVRENGGQYTHAAIWTVRLLSSTTAFGQTTSMISRLETNSPRRSIKRVRISKAREPRGTTVRSPLVLRR